MGIEPTTIAAIASIPIGLTVRRLHRGGSSHEKWRWWDSLPMIFIMDWTIPSSLDIVIACDYIQRGVRIMEDIVLAYYAGLFDGEGTVTLIKHCASDRFRRPAVSLTSTTYEFLFDLKRDFGGCICIQKKYKDHHKQSWSWRIIDRRAILFLENVLPFLRDPEKIRRSRLILANYSSCTPRNGKYTEQLTLLKQLFEEEFFHPSTDAALPVNQPMSL